MTNRSRTQQPLDAGRLEELALAYVARFATTRSRLEDYLARKLRERGWSGEGQAPVAALAERLAAAGYVDDAAWAKAKSGSLLRSGYGMRRIAQTLGGAGVGEEDRKQALPGEAEQRRSALALARKRRFGPFGREAPDRARREKQIAAMLRAGHPLDSARELVDAPSIAAAEQWVADSREDDACA